MPAVRRVLVALTVEVAKRPRICHRNRLGHSVAKGSPCLVVRNTEGGSKNYCPLCALEILDQASRDLEDLRRRLSQDDDQFGCVSPMN